MKTEVCNAAKIGRQNRESESAIIRLNQEWAKYLVKAVYAVDVAGGFAGWTDLKNLCNRIKAVVTNSDIRAIERLARKLKSKSATPPLLNHHHSSQRQDYPAPPTTITTPTLAVQNCTHPQGFTNTVVPLAPKLAAGGHFQIPRPYNDAQKLIITIDPDIYIPFRSIHRNILFRGMRSLLFRWKEV